ncbi:MAG TPA: hypothetical protein VM032_09475, partial [Vicinamibacterales bacterium]|nr:hypothetical protein [Vicinamibacterales bacterium]
LSARSRGLTMQVAGGGLDLMDKVIANTGWTKLTALPEQPVGELIVAAELARAANLGDQAMVAALQLRADGASWGLIALEQGVGSVPPSFEGLDRVVVPTVAPAVRVALTPETPTTTPAGKTRTTAPTIKTQPPVTVPPEPAATQKPSNPVAGLMEKVDNLVGGLLGR